MGNQGPCRQLAWDSEFFSLRIAEVAENRLSAERMVEILDWCRARAIECLYFLADADDPSTVRLAEDHGFRLVDVRVTLERRLDALPAAADPTDPECGVRAARPEDIPGLHAIARVSHTDSRFYADPAFPVSRCDALYQTWIEKSCRGYADHVLVAEFRGSPAGYVSCHLVEPARGKIGLMAVRADLQGRGIGNRLVFDALRWFAAQGCAQVTVVTQGRNHRAQRLYQNCGFRTSSVRLCYHRWFHPAATGQGS